jgi:putative membrane protein
MRQRLSWIFLIAYALWEFGLKGVAFHYLPIVALNFTEQLLLAGFFLAHALAYYGGVEVAVFAACSIVVSNVMENLSIITGFPFGYYYHTPLAGPKLFNVPLLVTLVYLGLGYVSWMVTQVLLRRTGRRSATSLVFLTPLVAAFVFSAWDLCIDPIYGTIFRAFIYQSPGAWFGTPVGNYFGWLLTTYLFYLPFSLFLRSNSAKANEPAAEASRSFWLQPILMYAITAFGVILGNLAGPHVDVTVANGKVWNTGDIYGASTLATLFTMIFISLLASISLYRTDS